MKSKFSVRLANLRKENGLSQRQVASKLGISQALLSHYENDAREPKFEFVTDACTFYKVTADYLLGLTDERKTDAGFLPDKVREIISSIEKLRREELDLLEKLTDLISK